MWWAPTETSRAGIRSSPSDSNIDETSANETGSCSVIATPSIPASLQAAGRSFGSIRESGLPSVV